MSRRSPRVRAQIAVTASFSQDGPVLACRTRDLSESGVFLDTTAEYDPGAVAELALLDPDSGEAIEAVGSVVRRLESAPGAAGGLSIRLDDPPPAWIALVERLRLERRDGEPERPRRRLRVLVVGDEAQRRGALALYVTSGWDVRFATSVQSAEEALLAQTIDAVIAEMDPQDDRAVAVLDAARRAQPPARRIVRAPLHGRPVPTAGSRDDLVHRVVDRDFGLEALLDALAADWGAPGAETT